MAVVGFDLGYQNCYVSVARGGGIETVVNEYSDRCTPTCISFGSNLRNIGASGKQQQVTNVKNTVYGFTRLLGRPFSDPVVQAEVKDLFYTVVHLPGDRIGVQVSYLGETHVFTPEQLVAMQLTKLRETAESSLNTKVVDVVINVPTCASDAERRALLDAAQIANLNCLRITNDTTAIGVAYGLYNKDLPPQDKPPRHVAFVDVGASLTEVSIVAFNDGKMRVIAVACDSLGGRDFDKFLFDNISAEFRQKYKINVSESAKASIRLMQECEKMKKLMSANSTEIPLNIECFMHDKDVSTRMKRATFEGLTASLLQRIENVMRRALADAKLQCADIEVVEITGGSVRMPAIRALVNKVFNKEPKTTLNSDEAVARGCSFMCAILSPSFRVREFSITDAVYHGITLTYNDPNKGQQREAMEVFPRGHPFHASRQITFYRHEPFTVQALYSEPTAVSAALRQIGTFAIQNVTPRADHEANKIKFKVRVNAHGIFSVCQAQIVERVLKETGLQDGSPASPQKPDTPANHLIPDDPQDGLPTEASPNLEEAGNASSTKSKFVNKAIDLPIQSNIIFANDPKKVMEAAEKESKLVMQDKCEHERQAAKNSLEELVYELRDKLSGAWESFATDLERDKVCAELGTIEDWLYAEGEDLGKAAYQEKLARLKDTVKMIRTRAWEAEHRPMAMEEFGKLCVHVAKAVESFKAGKPEYSHLDASEMKKLAAEVEGKQKWYAHEVQMQNSRKHCEDPLLTVEKLTAQRQALESLANSILSKPKPKVETPRGEEKKTGGNSKKGEKSNKKSNNHNANTSNSEGKSRENENMETE